MTVYVDDIRIPARVGGLYSRWSHLIADSVEELHEFAGRLGLRREWFQDPTVNGKPTPAEPGTRAAENWHYDVTDRKRDEAIAMGAQPVPFRELGTIITARWEVKQKARDAAQDARVRAADIHTSYMLHVEGCWYTGNPANDDGRGCERHNYLYDAWQDALKAVAAG